MPDYDSPWKDVLERYFAAFMAFFFPVIHAGIDWERGYAFLDKELQRVVRDARLGRRYADKLIQVWRRDGGEVWMLVHVEVQGQYETSFAERMFMYHTRIRDRYQRPVVSLAVLTNGRRRWRPATYRQDLWGCVLHWRYPLVKLLDYRDRETELETHANPFAVVVLAHLKAQDTARDPEARYAWKWRLARGLVPPGLVAPGRARTLPVPGLGVGVAGGGRRPALGGTATVRGATDHALCDERGANRDQEGDTAGIATR